MQADPHYATPPRAASIACSHVRHHRARNSCTGSVLDGKWRPKETCPSQHWMDRPTGRVRQSSGGGERMGRRLDEVRGRVRGLLWLSGVALHNAMERAETALRRLEDRGREGRAAVPTPARSRPTTRT